MDIDIIGKLNSLTLITFKNYLDFLSERLKLTHLKFSLPAPKVVEVIP